MALSELRPQRCTSCPDCQSTAKQAERSVWRTACQAVTYALQDGTAAQAQINRQPFKARCHQCASSRYFCIPAVARVGRVILGFCPCATAGAYYQYILGSKLLLGGVMLDASYQYCAMPQAHNDVLSRHYLNDAHQDQLMFVGSCIPISLRSLAILYTSWVQALCKMPRLALMISGIMNV